METQLDLKEIRTSKGWNQEFLASLMGVDQATISRWERREAKISGPARKLLKSLLPLYPDVVRHSEVKS